MSITNFDQALEDVVPEDMLSEPTDGDMMDVCSDILDVGLELSRVASCASLTLEGGLRSQEVGQGCSIPMEVTESPSALEVAVAENLVLKGGASSCPAPEGVVGNDLARVGSASCNPAPEGVAGSDPALVGSPSHTSMHGRPCWVVSTSIRWGDGNACFHDFEQTSCLGGWRAKCEKSSIR